jgi:hypothetical protein
MESEVECPECGTVIRQPMAELGEAILVELPLEPPRSRIIEVVKDGTVIDSYRFNEHSDMRQDGESFHYEWFEIVGEAINACATLRHIRDEESRV